MLPTVITGLKDESTCMQEEIFGKIVFIFYYWINSPVTKLFVSYLVLYFMSGPVVCVSPFETEEEVICHLLHQLCVFNYEHKVDNHV